MNGEIPMLTYNMLDDIKYGDKYKVTEDNSEVYHCMTDSKGIILIRMDANNGKAIVINKQKSKLHKALVDDLGDFGIFSTHLDNVKGPIAEMEAQK